MYLRNSPARGLRGVPAVGTFEGAYFTPSASPTTVTCGWFSCNAGDAPSYYTAGAAAAAAAGYSIPINAVPSGSGARVVIVNPDGTIVATDNWQTYPPPVTETCYPGTSSHLTCNSFKAPPMSVWFQYMQSLGVASVAAVQAANVAAAIAYAQAQSGSAAPGQNPSSYNGGNSGSSGNSGGSSPQLTFTTSRGGSSVQPGDTWVLRITGAAPNATVSAYSKQPSGNSGTNNFGSTDAQGNYQQSGTFDASYGPWQETWYVGGAAVGSFSFTVVAPASSGGGSSSGGSSSTDNTGSDLSSSISIGGTSIPLWALLVGVGALFVFGGKH